MNIDELKKLSKAERLQAMEALWNGNGYVSLCPELDIATQGETIEDARNNLQEALDLFFETASRQEVQARLHEEVYVTLAKFTGHLAYAASRGIIDSKSEPISNSATSRS